MYERLQEIFSSNGKTISNEQCVLLETYERLLLEQNENVNLISRKDISHVWENHILHSLSLIFFVDFPENANILDLGTGGGLPGIPLSILFSKSSFTLLDSIQKKIHCVQEMTKHLQLKNVTAICERAEILGKQKEFHRKFDVVVSRAVTTLPQLIEWSSLFLRKEGLLLVYKGGNISEEISASRKINYVSSIQEIEIDVEGFEFLKEAEKKLVVINFF